MLPLALVAVGTPALVRSAASPAAAAVQGVPVASSAPSAPVALPLPPAGVTIHAIWSDFDVLTTLLDRAQGAGLTWIRVDVGWSSLEPNARGVYEDWYLQRMDDILTRASARGLKVMFDVLWTPNWANGGRGKLAPPTDPKDFGRTMTMLAQRFQGRVGAFQIWNEPNHPGFYSGTMAQYVGMLKAAYSAVKAVSPTVPVVTGGTSSNDFDWIASMYANGAKGSFDVLATQPYQGRANTSPDTPANGSPYMMTAVTLVRDVMLANGDGATPIWFTEFGWSTHANTGGEQPWELGVTEADQSAFLIRALELVRTSYPYVQNVFIYNARDRVDADIQTNNLGLFKRNMTEKQAYRSLLQYLTGVAPPRLSVGEVQVAEGTDAAIRFVASLSRPAATSITVGYRTATITATTADVAGLPTGTLVFAPGETAKTVNVGVIDDTIVEDPELVSIDLSGPATGALMVRQSATATILDDDPGLPSVDVFDTSLPETNGSGATAKVTVQLTATASTNVTVRWRTVAGTANSSDYWESPSFKTLTIRAGDRIGLIYVGLRGDTTREPDEVFRIEIAQPSGAKLGRASATVTLRNDD